MHGIVGSRDVVLWFRGRRRGWVAWGSYLARRGRHSISGVAGGGNWYSRSAARPGRQIANKRRPAVAHAVTKAAALAATHRVTAVLDEVVRSQAAETDCGGDDGRKVFPNRR